MADHQVFDNRLAEYNDWILQATQKLEQCSQSVGDQESMEEKRAMIQVGCNTLCTHSLCVLDFFVSFRLVDLSPFPSLDLTLGFVSLSVFCIRFSFSLVDLALYQSFVRLTERKTPTYLLTVF